MARIIGRKALEKAVNLAQTDALRKGLNGEMALLKVLELELPDSSIVIWDPKFLRYKPDFLIIDQKLGFMFIEVKNWSLAYVKKFLVNGKSETIHKLKNPLGQTDNYINELQSYINTMRDKDVDIYRLTSSVVVYTGFSKEDFRSRSEVEKWKELDLKNYYKKHLFLDDLKNSAYLKLHSSKKFNTNLSSSFRNDELNYLAKSLGHEDEDEDAAIDKEAENQEQAKAEKNDKPQKTRMPIYLLSLFSIVTLATMIFLTFSNESNVIYEKAVEDAKFSLASGEYQQALGLYELALNENPEDYETKALYWSLMLFNDLTVSSESGDWAKVITAIDELRSEDVVPIHLDRQYRDLYNRTLEHQASQEKVKEIIEKINVLISQKQFEQARTSLDHLRMDQLMAQNLERNEVEVTLLSEQIEQGKKALLEEQKKIIIPEVIENPEAIRVESKKEKYIDKLNEIEFGLAELNYLYEGGVTSQILEAENESLKRWDDALNEIYGVLKTTLSIEEMDRLRNEQRDWIVFRDYEAEIAAKEFEGGSFEEVTQVSVKQQITRDRCYTLVENFLE